MECLDNIVGITKTGNACILADGMDASESLSGLFVDDTGIGRLPLSATVYDASDSDAVDFLTRLVPDAVKEANRMLYMAFEDNLIARYRDWNFKLPRKESYSRSLAATSGYYFMCLRPKFFRGSILKIRTLRIPATTGTIKILDEYGTEYYSGTQAAFTEVNLVLDRDYFIAYQSATRPYDYSFVCGCGGDDKSWKKWVFLGGGIADTLNDLSFAESNHSYGVIIEGTFSCDPFEPLCVMDFETNNWGRVYAYLVLLIARKNLAGWILSSGRVTTYLTTNGDELPALIEMYMTEIDKRVKFLPQAYNLTDCYTCGQITKGSILI